MAKMEETESGYEYALGSKLAQLSKAILSCARSPFFRASVSAGSDLKTLQSLFSVRGEELAGSLGLDFAEDSSSKMLQLDKKIVNSENMMNIVDFIVHTPEF